MSCWFSWKLSSLFSPVCFQKSALLLKWLQISSRLCHCDEVSIIHIISRKCQFAGCLLECSCAWFVLQRLGVQFLMRSLKSEVCTTEQTVNCPAPGWRWYLWKWDNTETRNSFHIVSLEFRTYFLLLFNTLIFVIFDRTVWWAIRKTKETDQQRSWKNWLKRI